MVWFLTIVISTIFTWLIAHTHLKIFDENLEIVLKTFVLIEIRKAGTNLQYKIYEWI